MILNLPAEIYDYFLGYLDVSTIIALRMSCRLLYVRPTIENLIHNDKLMELAIRAMTYFNISIRDMWDLYLSSRLSIETISQELLDRNMLHSLVEMIDILPLSNLTLIAAHYVRNSLEPTTANPQLIENINSEIQRIQSLTMEDQIAFHIERTRKELLKRADLRTRQYMNIIHLSQEIGDNVIFRNAIIGISKLDNVDKYIVSLVGSETEKIKRLFIAL